MHHLLACLIICLLPLTPIPPLAAPVADTALVRLSGPARIAVYPTLPDASHGCNLRLRRYWDGTLAWVGCPSLACGELLNCDNKEDDTTLWCECSDGGSNPNYLCLGIATQDPETGEITGYTCIKQNCAAPNACQRRSFIGPIPEFGWEDFYTCECDLY